MQDVSSVAKSASSSYYDFKGLNDIKTLSKQDSQGALDAAAKQVEGVFMQMLIKSMQQASDVLKSDLFSSNESDFYQDMFANQLAVTLSEQSSLGLADVIKQQLQHTVGQGQS